MRDAIAELLVTEAAIDKLGARGIATNDARQVPRRLLIGLTNGGRALALVIEQTVDPTTWLIVTGWDSSPPERKLLKR